MKQNFYHRNLPHWHPKDKHFFLTMSLKGSIPQSQNIKYTKFKKQFAQFGNSTLEDESKRIRFRSIEKAMDEASYGPTWLKDPEIAKIVMDSVLYRHQKVFDLTCLTIMPNHIHLIIKPKNFGNTTLDGQNLGLITKSLKSYTARRANTLLDREGAFWQQETFDHWIRNKKSYKRIIAYILNNPLKAGLVKNWKYWPWTWYAPWLENYIPYETTRVMPDLKSVFREKIRDPKLAL